MRVENVRLAFGENLRGINCLLLFFVIVLVSPSLIEAQTRAEGTTPAMAQPGSPAGSYSLSGFENVNLFNGNLNFSLPLVKIGGRGKASTTVNLTIDSARWNVEKENLTFGEPVSGLDPHALRTIARVNGTTYNLPGLPAAWNACSLDHQYCQPGAPMCDDGPANLCDQSALDEEIQASDIVQHYAPEEAGLLVPSGFFYEYYTVRENLQEAIVGYGPGMVIARGGKLEPLAPHNTTTPERYRISTLVRIVFLSPDGTEYELRDVLSDGKPATHWDNAPSNRGTVFESADGSGLRFVSDTPIIDFWISSDPTQPPIKYMTGYLYFPDGTIYRVESGNIVSIKDANGNKVSFTYNTDRKVTGVVDTLGRQVIFNYGHLTGDPELTYDEIKTQISSSDWQSIKIYRTKLENVLRDGYSLMNLNDMFPQLGQFLPPDPPLYNPENVVKKVELPDGRSYDLFYTPYKEIARVELPTGAAIEYDFPVPAASTPAENVFRPVLERRVYAQGGSKANGSTYDSKEAYVRAEDVSNTFVFTGTVRINECYGKTNYEGCNVSTKTDHYFYGVANSLSHAFYPSWDEGREYKTELRTADDTLKQRTETEWDHAPTTGSPYPLVPKKTRVKSVTSTVFEDGKSLTSKVVYGYDDNSLTNNRTDTWTYDYGIDTPGRLLKHSATSYLKINSDVNGQDYTAANISMPALPETTTLYDVSFDGSPTIVSQTKAVYDETPQSGNLQHCNEHLNLIGWDEPSTAVRGNLTRSKVWNSTTNSWLETRSEYDCFGNSIKSWDVENNLSQIIYSSDSLYAFPMTSISSAPDPSSSHGSNQAFTTSNTYDLYTGHVLTTNAIGQQTSVSYIDPATNLTDRLLRPHIVTAPNGEQTIFEYGDAVGNIYLRTKKQIDSLNWNETTITYDGLGRPIQKQAKDFNGDVYINTVYDNLGRIEKVSNPFRQNDPIYWTKTRYDELGRTVESYAPSLEANLENATSTSSTEFSLSTVPGFLGTVATVTNASGKKGRSIINLQGQLIRVDEPGSTGDLEPLPTPSTTPTPGPSPSPTPLPTPGPPDPGCYNGFGNAPTPPQCLTESAGAYPMESTYYKYDRLGRMVEVDQGFQKRYFLYDGLGRLLRVKQPEQQSNISLSLSDTITNNSEWTAGFTYDNAGRVIRSTDAKGINIISEYDNSGRIIRRCYTKPDIQTAATQCSQIQANQASDDTPAVEYFYDGKGLDQPTPFALGQLTKVTSSISTTAYTSFDNMGRFLNQQQTTDGQSFSTSYKYDLSGNLIEETYPSGEVVRNFLQTDGNLMRVAVSGHTYASDAVYTASGGVSNLRLGNGRWETTEFNKRHQVTKLALGNAKTDTSLWQTNYEYGELLSDGTIDESKNDGNITRQTIATTDNTFVQTYQYDSLSRLVQAGEKSGKDQNWMEAFAYDRYGNRKNYAQQIGLLSVTQTPAIDQSTNRFMAGQGFEYDRNGNVIEDQADSSTRSFAFDGNNKQINVKDPSGAVIGSYAYDGQGQRVEKTTNSGERTIFVYDALNRLVAEYSNQSAETPAISYTTSDNVGSPRVITDQSGAVTSRRDFMPFGEELYAGTPNRTEDSKYSAAGDNLRKNFTGYEKDPETGLDYAEARYYNNEYGRFSAVDPLLASGTAAAPQTFNRYVYVKNNPLIFTDSNGLDITLSFQEAGAKTYTTITITAVRNKEGQIVGRKMTDGDGNAFEGKGPRALAAIGAINKLSGTSNVFQGAINNLAGSKDNHYLDISFISGSPKVLDASQTRFPYPYNGNSTTVISLDDGDQSKNSLYNLGTEILNLNIYQERLKGVSGEFLGFNGNEGFDDDPGGYIDYGLRRNEPNFRESAFNEAQNTAAFNLGMPLPGEIGGGKPKPFEKVSMDSEADKEIQSGNPTVSRSDSDDPDTGTGIVPPPAQVDDDAPKMKPKPPKKP